MQAIHVIKRLLFGNFSVLARLSVAVKQIVRSVLVVVISYVSTSPALRNRLIQMISYFPSLRQQLVTIVLNPNGSQAAFRKSRAVPPRIEDLSPSARKTYTDIKLAIENKGK